MFRRLLVLAVLAPGAARADTTATPTESKPTDPTGLIRQLGSNDYFTREQATRDLVTLGRAAKDALLAGRDDPDAEIADRCTRILPQALLSDLQPRISRFKADKDGKETHDLPLWKQFQAIAGSDEAARAVFGQILDTSATSLVQIELDPRALIGVYEQQFYDLCNNNNQNFQALGGRMRPVPRQTTATLGALATVFLLGSDPSTESAGKIGQVYPQFLYQPAFTSAIANNTQGAVMRKLFSGWLLNRTEPLVQNYAINIIHQHNIKEAAPSVLKVAKDGTAQVYQRFQALMILGRVGDKSMLKPLAELLNDETALPKQVGGAQDGSVEIRDMALAITIRLAGQAPKDFGFTNLANLPVNGDIQYMQVGFPSDEKRLAAKKKWLEFAAKLEKDPEATPPKAEQPKEVAPTPQADTPVPPQGIQPIRARPLPVRLAPQVRE